PDRQAGLSFEPLPALLRAGAEPAPGVGWVGPGADRGGIDVPRGRVPCDRHPLCPAPGDGRLGRRLPRPGPALAGVARAVRPRARLRRGLDVAPGQRGRGALAGAEPVGVVRPLCVRWDDLETAAASDAGRPGRGGYVVKRSELRLILGAVLA